MSTFRVTLKACCPGRTQILDVQADNENDALNKASRYANRHNKRLWKTWKALKAVAVIEGVTA